MAIPAKSGRSRSRRSSAFLFPLLPIHILWINLVTDGLMQIAVIYTPVLNPIFKTQPLTPQEFAISMFLPALVLVAVEMEKFAIRAGWLYPERRARAPSAGLESG